MKRHAFNRFCNCLTWAMTVLTIGVSVSGQQIDIYRINQMPNMPDPYLMRDWKQVTIGYDSLVFDFTQAGEYLPLIWTDGNGVNYPEHNRFGLDSYVSSSGTEAINVLPAVIGASLVGIDKSNQNGINWALMCEEFFNRRPAENIYLNGFTASSGSDWWYETMPNIFFYQLYDLYPQTGDFDNQFTTIANQWLEAIEVMGGSDTPWHRAFMDYRAWSLSTMTPLDVGVSEPEAAGAIAWLLYSAYSVTGLEKYRKGAEWCLEFLNVRNGNPSFELQLPYGVYIAARMNAELGTEYDIEKMLNWCFNPLDNVRSWGATVGRWGNYDCDGLIGEAKYVGYAFAMNGFEQVGALVPMVRYDDRFTRAIGKWVLNCANASRLFYTNYLPDEHQDSEEWSHQYDPRSYIAHESMREYHSGADGVISPYATGDAINGGWAATNLALYGSSHVGILGGIIDTTNVEMILRLDALKTDYFHETAYPTYLYFNPHGQDQIVEIDVGTGSYDIYDAVSNTFLASGVTGSSSFTIGADIAVLAVLTPSGGTITYDFDRMLVEGVVVDYRSGQPVANYPPRIKSLAGSSVTVIQNMPVTLYCTAEDRDGNDLSYRWSATGGILSGTGTEVTWTAPVGDGTFTAACVVNDGQGGLDSAQVVLDCVAFINDPPVIDSLVAGSRRLHLGSETILKCYADDPNGDTLTYTWQANAGTLTADDSHATWTAPDIHGYYYILCRVKDTRGASVTDSVGILVVDTTDVSAGEPIVYYPFNGNANDESGNDHHGDVKGADLTTDRLNNSGSAYYFNGTFDLVQVPNHPDLNFQDAITVAFWMKADELVTNRESYPVSHGNWESRWKVSVTPEKKIRWTINTSKVIRDLDSQRILSEDLWYHVAAVYDGVFMSLFMNGAFETSIGATGQIRTTTYDLTIGQHLPDNPGYNYKGVLDEIRLYDYALSLSEIRFIYDESTAVYQTEQQLPEVARLSMNYPNPFNPATTIPFQLHQASRVRINVYNMIGQSIVTLLDEEKPAGYYTVNWDGKNGWGQNAASGIYVYEMRTHDYCLRRKLLLLK